MSRIYLDHAATTPVLPQVRRVVADALANWANPSSTHAEGRAARAALEDARRRIAAGLGVEGATLVFTSGASEALALAIAHARRPGRLVSAVEHDAVLRHRGDAGRLPVDGAGRLDDAALERALDGPPSLVVVQSLNNETGCPTAQDGIGEAIRAAGGAWLCDHVQGLGRIPFPDADMLALSAHKIGGPPGIGLLVLRDPALIEATGGQEGGYRGGTENLPAILGFAAAVAALPDRAGEQARLANLRRLLLDALDGEGEVVANGHPAILSLRMAGVTAATQLMHFDLAGIAVSAGAACASGSMKTSHVLTAMGLSPTRAGEVIRISFGRDTEQQEVLRFAESWRALRARTTARAA